MLRRARPRPALAALAITALAGAGAACSSPQASLSPSPAVTAAASPAPAAAIETTTTTAAPRRTTTAAAPTSASSPPPTATTAAPRTSDFSATVAAVTAADLGASWREGCPVGPEELRLVRLSVWGFDGQAHVGSIVVHRDVTDAVITAFHRLYDERFPIRRMEPIDAFGGDDPASMAADNTSGFNCRNAVADGPPRWSVHASGKAIDVNPVENPYIEGGVVQPPAGAAYVSRSEYRPGMAVDGGQLTAAFAAVGWSWGGDWAATPDYQHFSATGG